MNASKTIFEVCRTCMNEFTGKCQPIHLDSVESTFNPTTIRHKLEAFAPELDLSDLFSSVICDECAAAIDFIHKFKKKCLETEEHLMNYLSQLSGDEVHNDEDSFLKITAVQSFFNEAPVEQPPRLEIVDFDSVLLNTDSPVQISEDISQESINDSVLLNTDSPFQISEDISQESVNNDCLVSLQVINNENSESSDNNNHFQHNYTIFETFNMIRNKLTVLYNCNDCSYSLTHKSSINSHIKNHLKEKTCQCEECGFRSSLKTNLIAHAQNHSQSKLYCCNKCNFATALVSRISIHKKTHKCDKLFCCIKCNFATENANGIKSHLRNHKRNGCKECKLLICKEKNFKLEDTDICLD